MLSLFHRGRRHAPHARLLFEAKRMYQHGVALQRALLSSILSQPAPISSALVSPNRLSLLSPCRILSGSRSIHQAHRSMSSAATFHVVTPISLNQWITQHLPQLRTVLSTDNHLPESDLLLQSLESLKSAPLAAQGTGSLGSLFADLRTRHPTASQPPHVSAVLQSLTSPTLHLHEADPSGRSQTYTGHERLVSEGFGAGNKVPNPLLKVVAALPSSCVVSLWYVDMRLPSSYITSLTPCGMRSLSLHCYAFLE